ncbi:MAG: hypothetical protein K9L98_00945 [Candidatus Pacebacteria bacterium]|nr:hypothetical protein [Candidatus Paceibacterota bacterium]MCF7862562.1 hypothetical protein [Candidatus Paceibacterota bacterium]
MFKFLIPTILIGLSVALFLTFTNPTYKKIGELRTMIASYDEALSNSKSLETERDNLTFKFNAMNPSDLARLEKLMPDSVDNIRLILEIEKLALPYGMVLKDVKYNTTAEEENDPNQRSAGSRTSGVSRDPYGTWELGFSTEGVYKNFVNFLKDLERNLRIVDLSSIEFSSPDSTIKEGANSKLPQAYKYQFNVKTYWLKN